MIRCEIGMKGKVCMITGANSGIGKETTRELSRMGATIVMVCRNEENGKLALDEIKMDRYKKIGYLSDAQIEKIQEIIDNVSANAPNWMLNHQKDYDTGEDIHLVGSDIDMRLRDEINIMKKIRSYRGIRHERGLRVRGQRTRANNRQGLALGVSKKRES